MGSKHEKMYEMYHQRRREKKRQRDMKIYNIFLQRREKKRQRLFNYLKKNPERCYREIPQQDQLIIDTIYNGRVNKARYDAGVPLKFGKGVKLPRDKEAYLFLLYNLGYNIKDLASGFNLSEEKTYDLIKVWKSLENPLKKSGGKIGRRSSINKFIRMLYAINTEDLHKNFIQQVLKHNKLEIALEDISDVVKMRFDASLDIDLGSRNKDILYSGLGLITNKPKSLEDVGMEYGLSRERVRQIEKRAMKILSQPPNLERSIRYIIGGRIEFDDERDKEKIDVNEKTQMEEELYQKLIKSTNSMKLSHRAYNCLKTNNIRYMWELVQYTDRELLKNKNFGKKSLNEIKSILVEIGLNLGMKINAKDLGKFNNAVRLSNSFFIPFEFLSTLKIISKNETCSTDMSYNLTEPIAYPDNAKEIHNLEGLTSFIHLCDLYSRNSAIYGGMISGKYEGEGSI